MLTYILEVVEMIGGTASLAIFNNFGKPKSPIGYASFYFGTDAELVEIKCYVPSLPRLKVFDSFVLCVLAASCLQKHIWIGKRREARLPTPPLSILRKTAFLRLTSDHLTGLGNI